MLIDQKLKRALQQGHVALTDNHEDDWSHYEYDDRYDNYDDWERYPDEVRDEDWSDWDLDPWDDYASSFPSPLEQVGYEEDRDLAQVEERERLFFDSDLY